MANTFTITTPAQTLKADDNGHTTTDFTVTNTTSRPLRGIAKLKPLGNTEASWLKIEGESERDFPAGGTHQFTVNFNKPKPTALPQSAETFMFRLDAISAENPDEDFTEGQTVTVEIPEQKEEKKKFPWWIAAIAAAILLIVGGVILWLVLRSGGDMLVPDVTNKTYADAEAELTNKSFKAEKADEIAPQRSPDIVFKQDPEADTKAASNSTVKLSIPATTTVPPLKGLTLNDAINKLKKSGLIIGSITGDGDAIKNGKLTQVSSQNPKEETPVLKGSEVSINFPCVPTIFKPCKKIATVNDLKKQAVSSDIEKLLKQANPNFNSSQ